MTVETVDLYKYFNISKPDGGVGLLTSYIHYQSPEYCTGRTRPAMLVLPGGGYGFVSDRENEPIAVKYLAEGFNAFALKYSIAPIGFPAQLLEAAMAMVYIRENAEKFNVIPDKVAAVGFSAGGHLLGTLCTMYNAKEVVSVLGEKAKLVKPDAAVFSYAVITSSEKTHAGSIDNLCGNDAELRKRVSIENNINGDTPPAFIWATVNDNAVPSENSLLLAMAYKKAGVPFELHLFGEGVHGLSLASRETAFSDGEGYMINDEVKPWMELSIKWLKKLGFEIKY